MNFKVDSSISEYEHIEVTSNQITFNGSSDIRFEFVNENAFTHPSNSYLFFEGSVKKAADGTDYAAGDNIALVKEGMLYLLNTIRYQINNRDVETINDPGRVQNMLSYLLEDESYNNKTSLVHCGMMDTDEGKADTARNVGFARRKTFGIPNFSFYNPLNRILGFFLGIMRI